MLPNEDDNREEIRCGFRDWFALGEKSLAIAVQQTERLYEKCRDPGCDWLDSRTKTVIVGICSRETRRYRSILALLEIGHIEDADVLTRSLYEGFLSERYILLEPRPACSYSPELRAELGRLPDPPNDLRPVDFRARLYAAHLVIQKTQAAYRDRVVAQMLTDANRTQMDFVLAEMDSELGHEWVEVLTRRNRGYSGLSIRSLAERCEMKDAHSQLYKLQCLASHANDPFRTITFTSETINVGPKVDDLPNTLQLATSLELNLLDDVSKAFELGMEPEIQKVVDDLSRLANVATTRESS